MKTLFARALGAMVLLGCALAGPAAAQAVNSCYVTYSGSTVCAKLDDIYTTQLPGKQPSDGDLTSLAGASSTGALYYRSATSTWAPVTIGSGVGFSGGTLTATGSGGTVSSVGLASTTLTIGGSASPITSSGAFTVNLPAVGTAGAYGSATKVPQITLDAYGRVSTVAGVTITPAWGSITSTPTTLAGYGITDGQALSPSLTNFATQAWTAGTQVPVLTAANTWGLKTVGAAAGNLLDKASGDSLYLGLTATAADSSKLGGVAAASYLQSSTAASTYQPLGSYVTYTAQTLTGPQQLQARTNINAQVAGTYPTGTGTSSGSNTGDQPFTASGDATAPSSFSTLALTLATVNSNVGTFGSSSVVPVPTVNAKGLVTGVTTAAITPAAIGAQPAGTYATGGGTATGTNTGDETTSSIQTKLSAASVAVNQVYAGPASTGPAAAAFRALVPADIPSLSATYQLTSGRDSASGYAGLDGSTLLKAAEFPAETGDVTRPAGSLVNTLANTTGARANLGVAIGVNVQAWDADLDCQAALTTTGFLKRTGAGLCAAAAIASGDIPDISATYLTAATAATTYQPADPDLTSIAGNPTGGFLTRTAANTYTPRSITAGTGISVTNGDGVAGPPTIAATAQTVTLGGAVTGTGTTGTTITTSYAGTVPLANGGTGATTAAAARTALAVNPAGVATISADANANVSFNNATSILEIGVTATANRNLNITTTGGTDARTLDIVVPTGLGSFTWTVRDNTAGVTLKALASGTWCRVYFNSTTGLIKLLAYGSL